jgi:hypothetical protein
MERGQREDQELESDKAPSGDDASITSYVIYGLGLILFGILLGLLINWMFTRGEHVQQLDESVLEHFPATIGLPFAAVAAFVICSLFRTTEGRIRFSALGVRFEGASGPIVMWIFCLLAVSTAIRLLWPLTIHIVNWRP